MKFYDKYYTSNYEELITYYPRFYRDVFEMVEILKAHGRIADGMEDNIEQAYLNGFIDYADEATIAKLERFLEIGLNRNRTLEERRRLVKSYFVGFGKISATLIKQMIGAYTNAPVDCRFEPFDDEGNNMLFIDFQRSGNETIYMSYILMLLSKKLPAHIAYRPELVYRFPVVVGRRRKYYRYGYDLCGTKPDTALLGISVLRDMVTQQEHSNTRITYKNADEENELAGTYPETTTQGQYLTWDVATAQEHESSVFRYEEAGEHQQTGKHPGTAFLGEAVRAALGVEAGHENSVTDYEITGTKPDTVLLAAAHAGPLAVKERRENALTEYEATGTKPEAAAIAQNLGQMTAISQKVEIYTTEYEKSAETAHTGAEPGITTAGNSKVIDAGAGATATECSVDYTPCGTTFTQS